MTHMIFVHMKLLNTMARSEGMLTTFQALQRGFVPETDGQKLERFLARAEMQQKDLAAKLGVDASYISRMVKDRIGWVRGQYFGQIASILRLKDDEIRELNPAAVVNITPTPDPPDFPPAPYEDDDEIYMPEALQEAIDRFGDEPEYAGLKDPDIQRQLALLRRLKGAPTSAGEWLTLYSMNRRWLEGKD